MRQSEVYYAPEGLTLHVLFRQAVVGERLVPHRVAGVSQRLCAQLVRLLDSNKGISFSRYGNFSSQYWDVSG